ncbi:MAG: hypothetical protein E6H93_14240, partial [Chloroflexi bacterium]
MRRCYGQQHRYRHTKYHLHEWHRRRRLAFRRNLIVAFIVLLTVPLLAIPAIAAQTVGDLPSV